MSLKGSFEELFSAADFELKREQFDRRVWLNSYDSENDNVKGNIKQFIYCDQYNFMAFSVVKYTPKTVFNYTKLKRTSKALD